MKNKILQLCFYCLLVVGCSEEEAVPKLTADFDVQIRSEFNNTIYPSLIFGLTEIEKQQGEAMDYFSIEVKTNRISDIKIVIEQSKLNFETVLIESNVSSGKTITPAIKWKYDDLMRLTQPGNVDMTFVCYGQDNLEIGRKTLKATYRSINECVFGAELDNEFVPLYFMMAGYVNEDSPKIDQFLSNVLQQTDLQGFVGYQSGASEVQNQVEASFYTMRALGVKYSSITATSNTNPNIFSQHIRFSDEVLNNSQANCADGTVFFCSILRKVSIHSLMIFVPGHVYLGYYLDSAKTQLQLLETTMVGNVSADFIDATNHQISSFNTNLSKFNNGDYSDGYFIIDIDQARNIIKPIGR